MKFDKQRAVRQNPWYHLSAANIPRSQARSNRSKSMAQPYVGEIRIFAGNFAPVGWELCQGQLIAISQNEVLFNLIGTTYGGDGQTTFALPDLQGRLPVHTGSGFVIGQVSVQETVTLSVNQIPAHNHLLNAVPGTGTISSPTNAFLAASALTEFSTGAPNPADGMNAKALGNTGGSQPHDNMSPYLVVNFIISLFGVYPPQN
jgi:microcystin-dependent protein